MATTVRVIVPVDTMEPEAWQLAVAYALKIAKESSPPATDVILLTHGKDQLSYSSLADHIGAAGAKALAKGATLPLQSGTTLRHATLRTLGHSSRNSIIIAFYADDSMLEKIDGQRGVTGVVAVPDPPESVNLWRQRWNPVAHGEERVAPEALVDDPVIEKALESITLRSNIAYNVLHPRDKEYANEVFRILRAKGHSLDAGTIKSWAIRKGWKPGGADELSHTATKVAQLKHKPSLTGIYDPEGRYTRWNSTSAAKD